MKNKLLILTTGIFLLAAFFRLYDLNWDQGQHLHPDERFLTMVATDISWPKDLAEYLDTQASPLNPHNRGFGFFVYGSFPVFFTKWIAETLGQGDYGNLTLVGRQLSAFFDLGTVLLVFLIAQQISNFKFLISNQIPNPKSKLGQLEIRSIRNFPLIAMFLYSIMVLPIQLSHFYAVDTYLTFFITLTFYLCSKFTTYQISNIKYQINILNIKYLGVLTAIGISFGLALASKISALLFLPIIILFFTYASLRIYNFNLKTKIFNILYVFFIFNILFLISTYVVFRLAQPYAFANGNVFDINLNPKLLDNWKQLEGSMKPDSGFPPSVQWFGITPFLFPLASIILWGLGLPLGIIAVIAVIYSIVSLLHCFIVALKKITMEQWSNGAMENILKNRQVVMLTLITFWIILLFLYQSSQPAPTIRYFLLIYPFLAILSGYVIVQIFNKFKISLYLLVFIGVVVIIYPLSFLSIYSRPHSRVAASEWIYQNIPYGVTLATEHWDDGLPMTIDAVRISQLYKYVSLPLYDPDKPEKWPKIAKFLNESDYIVLTSNRLWGSITKAKKLFPQTSRYYQLLFDGSLGFEKIAEITSFPNISLPFSNNCLYLMPPEEYYLNLKSDKNGILGLDRCNLYEGTTYQGVVIRDELAEETFTVYDHPKVLIFKKVKAVDYLKLLSVN